MFFSQARFPDPSGTKGFLMLVLCNDNIRFVKVDVLSGVSDEFPFDSRATPFAWMECLSLRERNLLLSIGRMAMRHVSVNARYFAGFSSLKNSPYGQSPTLHEDRNRALILLFRFLMSTSRSCKRFLRPTRTHGTRWLRLRL